MESSNQLSVFSLDAIGQLLNGVSANQSRYLSTKSWALEWLSKTPNRTICTRIRFEKKLELKIGLAREKTEYDLDNSIRMHQFLYSLTPVQARDPRLWTFLAHETCWEYMISRWPVPVKQDSSSYINEHYFVTTKQSRALIRHGIARLWWYGYLTYDASRTDPYELTHVLLKTLDITASVLERNLGKNRLVRVTLLEFFLEHNHIFLQRGESSKIAVRTLVKSLNLRGGSAILDAMPKSSLRKFLSSQLSRIEKDFE
jgi:hypothetical protein